MKFPKTLTLLILAAGLAIALPAWAQQKPVEPGFSPAHPFTQNQVSNMVRAGLGDDSGAKLIEQRGIDFAPSEDFYQTLKAGENRDTRASPARPVLGMADPRAPTRDAPTSPRAHDGRPYASWFGGNVHGGDGKPTP